MLTQEQLIGREAELRAIRDLVATASRDGGALLIRGEAGIGKSSLLAEAERAAAEGGVRVLRITGVRTEASLAFAGLHQLLRPLLGQVAELPVPQRSALQVAFGMAEAAPQDPFLISLACLTLLTEAGAEQPVLVLVDDAHWLDRSTDEVLAFIGRRLGSDPVGLLVAIRDGEPATAVEAAGLPVLEVQPLPDVEARILLDRRAGNLASAAREQVLRQAAGNPLALVELPATARTRASTDVSEPLPLTDRIERAFAGRLRELPGPTRTLLLLAALCDEGRVEDMVAAARTLGLQDVGIGDLTPAVDAGLASVEGNAVRFRHPLVRSAAAMRVSEADERAAHLALASVLEDPDRVAWHRAAAASGPDAAAAALLEDSAERAERRGAIGVAVSTLERSAALTPDGQVRGRRLLAAADRAYGLGRYDTMARVLADAQPLEVPDLEARRQAWLQGLDLTGAKTALETTNIRRVVGAAATVAAARTEEGIDQAQALLSLAAARSWWMEVSADVWDQIVTVAESASHGPDDPRLLYVKAAAAPVQGAEVVERLRARLRRTDPLESGEARVLGTCAMWVGDLDAATAFFGAAMAAQRREGRLGLVARGQVLTGWCAAHLGRFAEAAPALDEGYRLSIETDQENFIATAAVALTELHALRGDLEAGARTVAEAERHARAVYADGLVGHVRHARGLLELAAGRYADAFDSLRHLYEPGDEGAHLVVGSWAIADLADAAVPAGRAADAVRYLDRLERYPGLVASPWQQISMPYARALIAADAGDDATAERLFLATLGRDLERWPLPRARVLLAYGIWLRRQRRVAESRDPLRSARDLFDAIGVPWMAERARHELGAAGEVSGVRRATSVDELTPQELQIAQLAAAGLSNREIGERLYLSHRTVSFHLYHVYPKLGISSRAQLHAALGAA